jgi:signal transduction histidine kinase
MSAYADPGLLRIVLINLLGNAWKFSAQTADARIEVGHLPQQHGAFFVRDNGAGFDMAFADKLFAPFQRLHSDAEFEGTGIGLAIVKRIIARHGGRVWAESAPGAGTTVYFTLPCVEDMQRSA